MRNLLTTKTHNKVLTLLLTIAALFFASQSALAAIKWVFVMEQTWTFEPTISIYSNIQGTTLVKEKMPMVSAGTWQHGDGTVYNLYYYGGSDDFSSFKLYNGNTQYCNLVGVDVGQVASAYLPSKNQWHSISENVLFVWGNSNNDAAVANYKRIGATVNKSIRLTGDEWLVKSTNHYVVFTSNSSAAASEALGEGAYNNHIYCSGTTGSGVVNSHSEQGAWSGSKEYKVGRYALSQVARYVDVSLTGTNASSPEQRTYNFNAPSLCDGKQVTPSVTQGTASPSSAQCITSGSDVTFTITPSSGYKMPSSATFSGAHTAIEIDGYKVKVKGVTGDGTLTVKCVEDAVWTLRGEFNNWSTTANVFEQDGNNYTLSIDLPANTTYAKCTDNAGFKLVKTAGSSDTWYGNEEQMTSSNCSKWKFTSNSGSSYNCGLVTGLDGPYIFSFTLNDSKEPVLTVTYPTKKPTVPVVRWGNKATVGETRNIHTSEYIAAQGCDGSSQQTITKLRVRFWKEGDEANAQIIESAEGTYTINNVYDNAITIPYDNSLLLSCTEETNIYMEVAGQSAIGWSDYSDRAVVTYQSKPEFVLQDLEKAFNACADGHQFNLSEMVGPTPDSWSAVVYETTTSATSEFTLKDGIMTWNNTGKTSGEYKYTFTFVKEGFTTGENTADLTITYNIDAPTADITDIVASQVVTNPLMDVSLSTTIPDESNITNVVWSVSPKTELTTVSTTEANFRGMVSLLQVVYTVTAKGITNTCVETAGKTIKITVNPDEEDCK